MMQHICLSQDTWVNVHIDLKEENRMKVGHEHNNWDKVDEPNLEVFVTSRHQLTCRNVKD